MSRSRKVRRRLYNLKRNESAIYESRFAPCFSDYQIEFCIRNLLKIAKKSKTHFCVTFLGFDQDERELYEIPEANELAQRCIDRGLLAFMTRYVDRLLTTRSMTPSTLFAIAGHFNGVENDGISCRYEINTLRLVIMEAESEAHICKIEKEGLICSNCGVRGKKHKECSKCRGEAYCSRKCQKAHWKSTHKKICGTIYQMNPELVHCLSMKEQSKEVIAAFMMHH